MEVITEAMQVNQLTEENRTQRKEGKKKDSILEHKDRSQCRARKVIQKDLCSNTEVTGLAPVCVPE